MDLNTLVILIYFTFLIIIGWTFRNLTKNTSDYFRSGGNVLWWMVTDVMFDLLRGEVASVDTTACPEVAER